MSKEEFIAKFRGQMLLFITEAWAVRKEQPSSLGIIVDEHHIRVRQLLGQMYDALNATIPAKQPIDPIKPPPAAPQQQRKP